jgi:hypothetical protein
MHENSEMLISVVLSAFFGGSAAGLVSVRREVNIGQTVVASLTACLISSAVPFGLMALNCHWAWSVPISTLAGFLIYGILAWVDINEKRVPTIDLSGILPKANIPPAAPQRPPVQQDTPSVPPENK